MSALCRKTGDAIEAVRDGGQVVYVTRRGRPAVVLVGYEDDEALIARLEDIPDLASPEAGTGEAVRPYDASLAELGSSGTGKP